jgi:hypothetical protein
MMTKTIEVAIYPDGHTVRIVRETLGWRWDRDSWSSHKDSAKRNAEREGAVIERRPNPNYHPAKLPVFDSLTRGMFQ